jgi:aminoglycoside/choline kinase family phosphotransferase
MLVSHEFPMDGDRFEQEAKNDLLDALHAEFTAMQHPLAEGDIAAYERHLIRDVSELEGWFND